MSRQVIVPAFVDVAQGRRPHVRREGLPLKRASIRVRGVVQGVGFFTLYGHLTRTSIAGLERGRPVAAGETIARIGSEHENGGWPPHLHFQVIAEMGEYRGDYPGVTTPSERERFRERCPNPNLILGIPGLGS